MKNKLFLRKDISIDTNRLARICVQVGQIIAGYNKDDSRVEILETLYARELEELETQFIEKGMHFQWIVEGGTYIGILAIADAEITTTPFFMQPFKEYTPDIKVSNLKEVQAEHIKKMQDARATKRKDI